MVPKTGGERPLGIPTTRERLVHTVAKLILEPLFEVDLDPAGAWLPSPAMAPNSSQAPGTTTIINCHHASVMRIFSRNDNRGCIHAGVAIPAG